MTCGGMAATQKLQCAVACRDVHAKPSLVVMCNVHACGEFLDVQSAITILQVSLQILDKIGPNSLIFFNDFFQSSKVALKVRNMTYVLGI